MLSDVAPEDILRAIADGLESTVLPALAGAAERRQCRAAIHLTRGIANALPQLDAVIDTDIAELAAALSLPPEPPPSVPLAQRRARRDDLVRQLSRAIAGITDGDTADRDTADSDTADSDTELLLAAARRSVERWLAVFPAGESLGAFVDLQQRPLDQTRVDTPPSP